MNCVGSREHDRRDGEVSLWRAAGAAIQSSRTTTIREECDVDYALADGVLPFCLPGC
jgi:hypothetical protein